MKKTRVQVHVHGGPQWLCHAGGGGAKRSAGVAPVKRKGGERKEWHFYSVSAFSDKSPDISDRTIKLASIRQRKPPIRTHKLSEACSTDKWTR